MNITSRAAVMVPLIAMMVACGRSSGEASGPMLDPEVAENDCAVLTLKDVSMATGVSEGDLEQRAYSGCLYSWEDGTIWLASVRVHETIDGARREFARFTADVDEDDIAAQKRALSEELKQQAASGDITEESGNVGAAVVELMPEEAITHRTLEGVGSEAKLSNDGSARIRYGNVTVWFTGKTGDRDWIDPPVATEVGRRIVRNLDAL